MREFDRNQEMNAAIKAKIEAALAKGVDLTSLSLGEAEHHNTVMFQAGVTPVEQHHKSMRSIYGMINGVLQVELGRRAFAILDDNNCRTSRENLLSFLSTYFDAVDAGEAA